MDLGDDANKGVQEVGYLRNLLIKLRELYDIDYEGKNLYFIEGLI